MINDIKVSFNVDKCDSKLTIRLTHEDVQVTLHEADLVNLCVDHFGVDEVISVFSNNKQFYFEIEPLESLSHFLFYNGTGDWKFEFVNEDGSDTTI